MIVLGIDPGPMYSGWVLYDDTERRVLDVSARTLTEHVEHAVSRGWSPIGGTSGAFQAVDAVVVERPSAGRMSSGEVMRTAEAFGGLRAAARHAHVPMVWMYRRDVLATLGVSGGGRDAKVRAVCIEEHGGDARRARGSKAEPGPLYGVSSHAWQALGVVLAARRMDYPVEPPEWAVFETIGGRWAADSACAWRGPLWPSARYPVDWRTPDAGVIATIAEAVEVSETTELVYVETRPYSSQYDAPVCVYVPRGGGPETLVSERYAVQGAEVYQIGDHLGSVRYHVGGQIVRMCGPLRGGEE